MKIYLKLLRVEQWIKNLFVFIPVFFSGQILEITKTTYAFISFFIFCLAASCIYIVNDYVDIENDKLHPEKKKRPLSSGELSKSKAKYCFIILFIIMFLLQYIFGNWHSTAILLIYILLNILYSFKLKNIAILDVLIIASGFVLRIIYGGYFYEIPVTDWTIVLVFDLALILALAKRRGELLNMEVTGVSRTILKVYNKQFLDSAIIIACTITIVSYLMFILSEDVQNRIHHFVVYTFVLVFAGVLKYLQLTFVLGKTESPTKIIYSSRFLQVIILIWIMAYASLIYMK